MQLQKIVPARFREPPDLRNRNGGQLIVLGRDGSW